MPDKKEIKIEGLDPKNYNPKRYGGGICSRETVIMETEKTEIDFEKGIDAVATTENPAIVADWDRFEYIREVLPMRYGEMPDEDDAPLLDCHTRYTIHNVLGGARKWITEGISLLTKIFVSEVEASIRTKIKEKYIKKVSLGYKTDPDFTVEVPKGATVIVDGVEYKNEFNDGFSYIVRTWWKVKELSLVPIGADDLAKFRAEQDPKNKFDKGPKIRADDPELQKIIDEAVSKKINSIQIKPKGEKEMPPEITELTVEQRADQAANVEVERRMSIHKIAEQYGKNYKPGETKLKEYVQEAIEKKYSVDYVKSHILDNFDSTKMVVTPGVDLSDKEKRDYSLSFAITQMSEGKFGAGKSGLVKEVSDEIEKSLPTNLRQGTNSFLVPNEYFGAKQFISNNVMNMFLGKGAFGVKDAELMMKAMDATTGGSGGVNLVGDSFRPDLYIPLLRAKMALGAAGVTILTGLKENITIPKQLTDATFALTTEGVAASESALTFDQLTSAPNIGSGWVEFTKQLLIQGNPSIDALVRESLLAVQMRGVDKYGLIGGGGITGLLNESGPSPIVIGGDPDWTEIVSFETAIANADADEGDIKWLMSPTVRGRAKSITKANIAGTQFSGWLMDQDGSMNGYESVVSTILNQDPMDGYYLILGVFKQMMLNIWGATEIQVNPFSKDTQGIIRVVIMNYFDWIVRQPTAFAISSDVTES